MRKPLLYILFCLILCAQSIMAQCYPDRHSTTWFDGWVSCDVSPNPNMAYGETHWIMYDFGYEYQLLKSVFWNSNEPDNINFGIQEFNVDYSKNGVTWTNLGVFTLNQASGLSTYEGEEGPDFNKANARYVLITPTSNYGGSCFGFSELKISITDPLELIDEKDGFNALVYPNPFTDNTTIRIISLDENAPITYKLYDILGREVISNSFSLMENNDTYPMTLNGKSLTIGIYILIVQQNNKTRSFKLIKNN